MKVYLLYLKSDKSLYAFTATKEYFKLFLEQRNPKCFIISKHKMTDSEFSHFSYSHKNCQIVKDVFEDGKNTTELMITISESSELESELDRIDSMYESIVHIFTKYPLLKKYQKAIKHLTTIEDKDGNLLINTLSLFVDLNRETFVT